MTTLYAWHVSVMWTCLVLIGGADGKFKLISVLYSIVATLSAYRKGFRHIFYLKPSQLVSVTRPNWIGLALTVMALATSKVSVAILIGRIMAPSRWRKVVLYFLSITSMLVGVLAVIIIFAQCSPVQALWDPKIGKCWNPAGPNIFNVAASSGSRFIQSLSSC